MKAEVKFKAELELRLAGRYPARLISTLSWLF